jgi:ABC-type branched-subunit amino acid transport system permease subunit
MNTSPTTKRTLILAAWLVMLIVSDLPDILITTLGGTIPPWMLWAKAGFLAAFLVLASAWKTLRPLWQYAAIFLTLFLFLSVTNLVRSTSWFQSNFNYAGVSFFTGYAAIFILDILVALAVLTALWLMNVTAGPSSSSRAR